MGRYMKSKVPWKPHATISPMSRSWVYLFGKLRIMTVSVLPQSGGGIGTPPTPRIPAVSMVGASRGMWPMNASASNCGSAPGQTVSVCSGAAGAGPRDHGRPSPGCALQGSAVVSLPQPSLSKASGSSLLMKACSLEHSPESSAESDSSNSCSLGISANVALPSQLERPALLLASASRMCCGEGAPDSCLNIAGAGSETWRATCPKMMAPSSMHSSRSRSSMSRSSMSMKVFFTLTGSCGWPAAVLPSYPLPIARARRGSSVAW
mmetsp:Transcript_94748/g.305869  ORF Transcript_94748/g.305869 Transcript_94748/m.305869 type:complete len:264 (+) Transcript_94748:551-1342(+)